MMKKLFFISFLFSYHLTYCQYNGTGSVTQGLATTIQSNLYNCSGGRVTNIGSITASDSTIWIVPAAVNFGNAAFPFASNLHNACVGANYANATAALAALNGSDIVTIDSSGELITAYIFADNYFELYINGVPVGKDNVPYTQFNSNIVRFRVNRPFTIAFLLVDWEENLGLGSENNSGFSYYVGDGGMVAVFKDSNNNTIAKTDGTWRAQTFYTSPITNLSCPIELGNLRHTSNCSTASTNNGTSYYGLHWSRPSGWMNPTFNDTVFPLAYTFTNATVGVNNKPAYTNFTSIFDDPANDAQFIWSSNLLLDNEVIVRYTVPTSTGFNHIKNDSKPLHIYPNPILNEFNVSVENHINPNKISNIQLFDAMGQLVYSSKSYTEKIAGLELKKGNYFFRYNYNGISSSEKIIVN